MALRKQVVDPELIQEHIRGSKDDAPAAHADDESNWLVSYADMMTLLCGFFIMLFSMAKLDEPQYERVREALSKQFGGEFHSPAQDAARFLTQFIEDAGLTQDAEIRTDSAGLSIVFRSKVFFDSLSAELRSEGTEVLAKLAKALKDREAMESKKFRVVIEGHTDGRPVVGGSFPSNWELSGARASRVVRTFLEQGFSASDMIAIGYGDTRPEVLERRIDGTLDEDALGKNRRVVIRVLKQEATSIPMPDAPTTPQELMRIPASQAEAVKAEGQALRGKESLPETPAPQSAPAQPAAQPVNPSQNPADPAH